MPRRIETISRQNSIGDRASRGIGAAESRRGPAGVLATVQGCID
jgi:hypothetical protein